MEIKEITVSELQNRYKEKCSTWSKTFDKILARCYRQIEVAFRNIESYCIFPVPEFILGIGTYNVIYCSVYIIKNLKQNGYKVKFIDPNILFITWPYTPENKILTITGRNIPTKLIEPSYTTQYTNAEILDKIDTEEPYQKEIKLPPQKTQKQFRNINDYRPTGSFI